MNFMKLKNPVLLLSTLFFLFGIVSPTFAMWGAADDGDNETARHTVIHRQLEDLEPLGAQLKDNTLHIPLKEDYNDPRN